MLLNETIENKNFGRHVEKYQRQTVLRIPFINPINTNDQTPNPEYARMIPAAPEKTLLDTVINEIVLKSTFFTNSVL